MSSRPADLNCSTSLESPAWVPPPFNSARSSAASPDVAGLPPSRPPTESRMPIYILTPSFDERRRTEFATSCCNGDFAQALRALPGGRVRGRFTLSQPLGDGVHRGHDEEIHRGSNEEEGHDRIDEAPDHELAAVHFEGNGRKIWFAENGADERCQQVLHEGGDHSAERSADYDGYGEVHDVSPQHE